MKGTETQSYDSGPDHHDVAPARQPANCPEDGKSWYQL